MSHGFDIGLFANDLGNCIGSAVRTAANSVNEAFAGVERRESPYENLPEAQYREGAPVGCGAFEKVEVRVQQICGSDEYGRELANPYLSIRASRKGVSLLSKPGFSGRVLHEFSIRNCCVYKHGDTGFGNPLLGAVGGGLGGAWIGGVVNPILAPIGGALGTVAGIAEAFSPQDTWYMDLIEHNGRIWTFRLRQESGGNLFRGFLDAHLSL